MKMKLRKRMAALLLAVAMALSVVAVCSPSDTYASSVNKITASSISRWSKAKSLELGDNKVTVKTKKRAYKKIGYYYETDGYVKFTAPKAGTYTFTFSGLKGYSDKKNMVLNEDPDYQIAAYKLEKVSSKTGMLEAQTLKTDSGIERGYLYGKRRPDVDCRKGKVVYAGSKKLYDALYSDPKDPYYGDSFYSGTTKYISKKYWFYVYTRTTSIKLDKGETVYVHSECPTSPKNKYSYTVNVKLK